MNFMLMMLKKECITMLFFCFQTRQRCITTHSNSSSIVDNIKLFLASLVNSKYKFCCLNTLLHSCLLMLNLSILDNGKQVLWQTVKNPDEMPHKAAFHQGLHCLLKITSILRDKNIFKCRNFDL